jgi:pimeloyl-ACP methyl ester carboxylesterase
MTPAPTLVLLHAFGVSSKAWKDVVAHLDGFDVVAPDLPGFGEADDRLKAVSVHDYADWVLKHLSDRGVGDFVLVGWSMGGKIALAAALQRPPGLRALILVAPSPPEPEPMAPGARQAERRSFHDPKASREALKSAAGDEIGKAPLDHAVSQRLQASRSAFDFWLDIGSKEDLSAEVEGLDLPVLVLSGREDEHLGPDAVAKHLKPHLRRITEKVIEDSGHLVAYEQPQALAEEIRNYVRGL